VAQPCSIWLISLLQTVVITGGSQGMGLAAAKLLSKRGANVVVVARQKEKLENAKAQIAVGASYLTTCLTY